jgi:hypothetical protein
LIAEREEEQGKKLKIEAGSEKRQTQSPAVPSPAGCSFRGRLNRLLAVPSAVDSIACWLFFLPRQTPSPAVPLLRGLFQLI